MITVVGNSYLSSIPSDIGQLKKLEALYLSKL